MASAAEFVKAAIRDNKLVVFSKTYCPYCTKAKRALASVGARPVVLELDERGDGDAIQTAVSRISHCSTVPQVFIGGNFIGGGDDTAALASSGRLKPMLEAAGVELA